MSNTQLQIVLTSTNIHETALVAATQWAMSDESRRGLNVDISAEKFGQAVADAYMAVAKQLIAASGSEVAS